MTVFEGTIGKDFSASEVFQFPRKIAENGYVVF
jgi:hypothetical protein